MRAVVCQEVSPAGKPPDSGCSLGKLSLAGAFLLVCCKWGAQTSTFSLARWNAWVLLLRPLTCSAERLLPNKARSDGVSSANACKQGRSALPSNHAVHSPAIS
jgi:hypothetical protein